mgnify:CR=1 FL=1
METTICAIATALGVGAISIIRISGPQAISVVNSFFMGKDLTKVKSHTINYGHFIDENKKVIDEVLISVMKAPRTFTKEDVVEINCHGGIAVTNKILEILLSSGCELAQPGEFTKRAYLNGRIDLVEAEAISDMIYSQTEAARALAIGQITGGLSANINYIRNQLSDILANIEVNIDYPEYNDIPVITTEKIRNQLKAIKVELNQLLTDSQNGRLIREGITITLIGKPNVGKSSLLNALIQKEKAIVTDVAGTTRDLVEASIVLSGIKINFIDTAGIRKTKDKIEQIGIEKSLKAIKEADMIILILNNNEKIEAEDQDLLNLIKQKNKIIFINKSDLEKKIELSRAEGEYIFGNTIKDNGLNALKQKIIDTFNLGQINQQDPNYVSNIRQISLIKLALKSINNCLTEINDNLPIDMLTIEIKNAFDLLGEVIGKTYTEELLDKLFSKFCVGK